MLFFLCVFAPLWLTFCCEAAILLFHLPAFQFAAFTSTAGGQRNCTGAAFASLKKFASHFFNPQLRWVPNQKRRLMQLLVKI
jgi:hypothetical protein